MNLLDRAKDLIYRSAQGEIYSTTCLLPAVKIWKVLDEQNVSYEFYRKLQLPAHSFNQAF